MHPECALSGVESRRKGCGMLPVGERPPRDEGAVEPFDFSVLPRAVQLEEFLNGAVLSAHRAQRMPIDPGPVGDQPLDTVRGEVGDPPIQKLRAGDTLLVGGEFPSSPTGDGRRSRGACSRNRL